MSPRARRRAYALFIVLAPSAYILAMTLTGCTRGADPAGSAVRTPECVTVAADGRETHCVSYYCRVSCDGGQAR